LVTRLDFDGPGSIKEIRLYPGEERQLRRKPEAPFDRVDWLRPPFDGPVSGRVSGTGMDGIWFDAELSTVHVVRTRPVAGGAGTGIEGDLAGPSVPPAAESRANSPGTSRKS
jgi:hypothetical protein